MFAYALVQNQSLLPKIFQITLTNAIDNEIKLNKPDLVIKLSLNKGSIFTKKYMNKHYQRGYRTTLKLLEELK
jgi:hypothetical protein